MLLNKSQSSLTLGDDLRPCFNPDLNSTVVCLRNLSARFVFLSRFNFRERVKIVRNNPERPTRMQMAKSLVIGHGVGVFLNLRNFICADRDRWTLQFDNEVFALLSAALRNRPREHQI